MVASSAAAAPPRRVLLTNDDGPESPFFIAWVPFFKKVTGWDCVVCIPADGQSFVSKSIGKGPIQVRKVEAGTYHVAGPPATCVNLGLYHLAPDCDFVVSGPNVGHNLGRGSTLSSGTLGAAMEGAIAGRRAVAISFPFFSGWNNWTDNDIEGAIKAATEVTQQLWSGWAAAASPADVYNVNVPLGFKGQDGLPVAPQVVHTHVDAGSQYASLYGKAAEDGVYEWRPTGLKAFEAAAPDPGGDVATVKAGHISVAPLRTLFSAPSEHAMPRR